MTPNHEKEFLSYTRHEIIELRSRRNQDPLGKQLYQTLSSLHILRTRGSRAGKSRKLVKNKFQSKNWEDPANENENKKIEVITGKGRYSPVHCSKSKHGESNYYVMPTRSTCTSISSRQLRSVHITAANNRTPTSCKIGSWNAFSINNKSAFIENYILSSNLDMFAIVETSHEATNSPSLIASSPSGYNFLDKARRPPPGQDATNLRGRRGGGICIFYRNHFRACSKDTGDYTTFEHLTTYFTFKDLHLLLVVIYRPGSMPITTLFFEEFSSLLATLSNYTCQLLILGDTNVKFDLPQDLHTKHMLRLLTSHSLTQLITEPTHNLGHTLDVIISRSSSLIDNIDIFPPVHSDHCIINFTVATQPPPLVYKKIERRSFANFDMLSFEKDLQRTLPIISTANYTSDCRIPFRPL